MLKDRRRIGSTLVLGGLLLVAGLTASTDLNPAIGPQTGPLAGGLGFANLTPQHQTARAPEVSPASQQIEVPPKMRARQEKDLRKYRFEKLKNHAAELAKLSAALKEELDKSNENILSLEVVDKAEKIEKLAKKIQDEAKMGT